MYLARAHGRTVTVGEIATRMAMSEDHLLKVVRRLVSLGYVTTIRGRRGGVRLATDPSLINIGQVVRETEGSVALVPCFVTGDTSCPLTPGCALTGALSTALDAFFDSLCETSIAEVVATGSASRLSAGVS